MTILTHPKWQFPLREAQRALGLLNYWAEESPESQQDRTQGGALYRVLQSFFGLPIPKGTILSNYYAVDGIWFQLKFHPNDVAADGNPIHESTTAVSGHHKSQAKASTSFTLYVGHVTPDESYPHWPKPRALVVRELGLYFTNYTQVRAALATLIDAVGMEYQAALPHYQAWAAMQNMPTDAQAATDYLRQLIRQALRRMPESEILSIVEPVEIPEADAADAAANLDGMIPPAKDVTLADLEVSAGNIIAKIDEMLAEFGPAKEFDGYDEFDPNNEPDDMDDDDDDDATDPDASDFDDEGESVAPDAQEYFTRRIPAGTEIDEAELNGLEFSYPLIDHPTTPVIAEA